MRISARNSPSLCRTPRCSDLEWDMHWADREWVYEVFDNIHLDHWQRVNHFRNGREVCVDLCRAVSG